MNSLIITTMTNEKITEKVLGNFNSIKDLIKKCEGLNTKIKRMSEEIDSLQRENSRLKKEIKTLKRIMTGEEY